MRFHRFCIRPVDGRTASRSDSCYTIFKTADGRFNLVRMQLGSTPETDCGTFRRYADAKRVANDDERALLDRASSLRHPEGEPR